MWHVGEEKATEEWNKKRELSLESGGWRVGPMEGARMMVGWCETMWWGGSHMRRV